MECYATFALDSLRKTRARENVPSQEEIRAIIARQEMSTTVHCHGGGSCKITINSHTTAGEVSEQTDFPPPVDWNLMLEESKERAVCRSLIGS